jgi:hypothetical protein
MKEKKESKPSQILNTIGGVFGVAVFLAFMSGAAQPARAQFTLTSGKVTYVRVASGHMQILRASVKSATEISGVTVTLQILTLSGTQVAHNDYESQTFGKGETLNYTWCYVVPSTLEVATYTMGVKVVSEERTLLWHRAVDAFEVGTTADWTTIGGPNNISWPTYQKDTAYWALDNTWGYEPGRPFNQTLTANNSTFQANTLIRFIYPYNDNGFSVPFGFPEIVYGFQAGNGMASPNGVEPPPTQIQAFTTLAGKFNIQIGGYTQYFDVLWETFPQDLPTGGQQQAEIAILLHSTPFITSWFTTPAAMGGFYTSKYDYSGQGITGTVYVGSNGSVPYVVLMPSGGDLLRGTIDLLGYLNSIVAQGILTGNEYLTGYELGNEPYGGVTDSDGNGFMEVNTLTYTWE